MSQLFIATSSPKGTTIYDHFDDQTKISDIKDFIVEKTGVPCECFYVTWQGRKLFNAKTLKEQGVQTEDTFRMIIRSPTK